MENENEKYLPTRQSLLSRLKDWNDQESWKEFFDTYWKLIYNTAIRSGLSDCEAQEVVQETVISMAKNIPGFEYDPSKGSFKNWMLKATNWRIRDQFKKRRPDRLAPRERADTTARTDAIERIADPNAADPGAVWDELWESNLVDTAIERVKRRVDPKQFQVFDLCVLQNLKPRKVAKMMQLSAPHVYLMKHRVSKQVKKEYEHVKKNIPSSAPTSAPHSVEMAL